MATFLGGGDQGFRDDSTNPFVKKTKCEGDQKLFIFELRLNVTHYRRGREGLVVQRVGLSEN